MTRNTRFRARPRGKRRHKSPPARRATLDIGEFGRHGDGIAEWEGARVFVPYTLPGERVAAEIQGDRAAALEILAISPDRATPFCPHFGRCGGCKVQHGREGFVAAWKHGIVETALRHQGIAAEVAPVIDAGGEGRRRVTLHVVRDGNRFVAGFMRGKSHGVEPIDVCPILAPALAGAVTLACALVEPLGEHASRFDVAMTATDNGVDAAISYWGAGAGDVELEARTRLASLAESWNLARLTLGGKLIAGRHPATVSMGLARVEIPAGAFLQATLAGEETLARLVTGGVGGARRIADLFAGLGPFTLRLAQTSTVHAVDSEAAPLRSLAAAASRLGTGAVSTEARDLFRRPLSASELARFDAVIFDPPRAGAAAQAEALAASKVPVAVAVSCDAATFARDAATLLGGGYRLETVTPVDQFKWSAHVETVGIFRRG